MEPAGVVTAEIVIHEGLPNHVLNDSDAIHGIVQGTSCNRGWRPCHRANNTPVNQSWVEWLSAKPRPIGRDEHITGPDHGIGSWGYRPDVPRLASRSRHKRTS